MSKRNEIAAEQDRIARIVGVVALVFGLLNLAAAAWMVLASEVIQVNMMICFCTLGFGATGWGSRRLMRGRDHE